MDNLKLIYLGVIVAAIAAVFIQWRIEVIKKQFYADPRGKRCRYLFKGKRIKGTVDWANGPYYYITPDKKRMATDLVNRENVKPIYIKLWQR